MAYANKQLVDRQVQYITQAQAFMSESLNDLERSNFDREELDKSLALCQLFKQSLEALHALNSLEIPSEFLGDEAEYLEGMRDDDYTTGIRDRLHRAQSVLR